MHIHLPKPLNGWREFIGEVGIIVVGVLIALGAEQLVESVHARHEVRDFREAADAELSYDLAAYGDRMDQGPCVKRRLDQLEQWLAAWKAGQQPVLLEPITRPTYLLPRTNVWQSRTSNLGDKLSLEQRVAYARFYDLLATYSLNVEKERDVWNQIQDYSHAERLGDAELMKLGGLIDRARQWQSFYGTNDQSFRKTAAQIGVRKGSTEGDNWDHNLCKPLRWRE